MRKILLLLMMLLVVGAQISCGQHQQVYGIGFYNLENLFDTFHDEAKNDYDFLPDGRNNWTEKKYKHKLRNMSQVLAEMGTDVVPGTGCAIIGVSEVENERCLRDLCNQPKLKERNFKYCHVEGPDPRGIDCALLYNPSLFKVRNVKLVPFVPDRKKGKGRNIRGFLTVSGTLAGEHVTVIVCHWPSRGTEAYYRELAGLQVKELKDSLQREDPGVKIIIMGDMNDDPHDRSMSEALGARRNISDVEDGGLYNPWWKLHDSGTGTLTYKNKWNLFDQIVVSQNLLNIGGKDNFNTLKFSSNQIFRRDYLFQEKGKHKGEIKRTHAGGTWLDGYSDHLPTLIFLKKEKR